MSEVISSGPNLHHAQYKFGLKDAAASERHGLGAGLLHAAHGHVITYQPAEHNRSLGSEIPMRASATQCTAALQLQTTGVDLNRAGKRLGEPHDTAVGDSNQWRLYIKRQQMMPVTASRT